MDRCRRIEDQGRSLAGITPPPQVLGLCEAVDRRGLALRLAGFLAPAELDDGYTALCRGYGCSS